ncbi:Plant protein of unknown function (DUF868) [Quillaja saponaria]|uniref:DUF868 domain-containing protein n=1 Tax=Quillaja saponaria TaxID=32244 RepID=A0AAD7PIU4_QUISA|nr:Plant protein of unknown function (DUF868) [Quillaja saponaria]
MHDSIGIPACFSFSTAGPTQEDPTSIIRSGQNVLISVYQTEIAGHNYLITIRWCKTLLLHGLAVYVQELDGDDYEYEHCYQCKVELKPWYFWRKKGSKQLIIDGRTILNVVWDLKAARFNGAIEPQSDYYVAIVCEEEVVLVVGDLKKDAFHKTGCRPVLMEPMLVSRKEHVFGKKKFSTTAKFQENGNSHELSIECKNGICNSNKFLSGGSEFDPDMEIKIDGNVVVHVKHLQWKFRGNQSICLSKSKVEVYWDVHDWLFNSSDPSPRHGLFMFRPMPLSIASEEEDNEGVLSRFCLFFYAWKAE